MSGRGLSLEKFGSLLLLATAVSSLTIRAAQAGNLTLSTERTTPVSTSTGDGSGPGNISIEGAGRLNVAAPTVVTIDSSHTVTNAGEIRTSSTQNATGILATLSSDLTSGIDHRALLSIPGPSDSGPTGTIASNAGIRLTGPGTFTGPITLGTSSITSVGGRGARGIAAESRMIGNLSVSGLIDTPGADSFAVLTTQQITGNATLGGTLTARGNNGVGAYFGGGVDGTITTTGSLTAGAPETLANQDGFRLTRVDPVPGRAGLWIASDVTRGVLVEGNRFTRAQESASADAAAATPADAIITTYGPGPAVLIGQGGPNETLANITLGRRDDQDYAFINRGEVVATGAIKGTNVLGMNVTGLSSGGSVYTTTLAGGWWNDGGNIAVTANDGSGTGLRIGDYAAVPTINNTGDITVTITDTTVNPATGAPGSGGGHAYGVVVETLGQATTLTNSGILSATAAGAAGNATGIIDRSGTISSFTNTGQVITAVAAGSTGTKTAIDLSANTAGGTFTNSGTITGNVLLGAGPQSFRTTGGTLTGDVTFQAGSTKTGNNTVTLEGGTVTGRINLGNGNHAVSVSGANAPGGFVQGTGTLSNFAVSASQISLLSAGPLRTQSASFLNASKITFDISNNATDTPLLLSTGAVTISGDSTITTRVTGIVEGRQVYTLIDAGSLTLGAPLSQIASAPASFMNSVVYSQGATPNTIILTVERHTAAELGLGPNMTAIYESLAPALNRDAPVAAALSAQATQAGFDAALHQLMPDSSGAMRQTALSLQDMTQGVIRRRLTTLARNGAPDHGAGDISSFWVQALGNFGDQNAKGEQNGFSFWGLGVALGADFPVGRSTSLGISLAETWHSVNLRTAPGSPVEFYSTQVNAYGRHQAGAFYVQGMLGGAFNGHESERRVNFGGLARTAAADWNGHQYGLGLEGGYSITRGLYELTPYLRASYLKVHEKAYTESGGGDGVNLAVDARDGESLRGSLGFALNRNIPLSYDSYVEAEFRSSYTREFMNDPVEVTARFASAGPAFTSFGARWGANRFTTGFGIAHKDSYSSVSLDYDAEISSGYLSHMAAVTVRFRF